MTMEKKQYIFSQYGREIETNDNPSAMSANKHTRAANPACFNDPASIKPGIKVSV